MLVFLIIGGTGALEASAATTDKNPTASISKEVYTLLALTNTERSQNNQPPLTLNLSLIESAQYKCNDMVSRNYWGHITPDGHNMSLFMQQAGIRNINKAAENMAMGEHTAAEVNSDWMNSPSHRDAILSPDYSEVGFAECVYDSHHPGLEPLNIYVEHFLAR